MVKINENISKTFARYSEYPLMGGTTALHSTKQKFNIPFSYNVYFSNLSNVFTKRGTKRRKLSVSINQSTMFYLQPIPPPPTKNTATLTALFSNVSQCYEFSVINKYLFHIIISVIAAYGNILHTSKHPIRYLIASSV